MRRLLIILMLCLAIGTGTVSAEDVYWTGKLQADYFAGWLQEGQAFEGLVNQLNLELVFPWSETVSAKLAGDISQLSGDAAFLGELPSGAAISNLSRMYLRVYRPSYDLTIGRQPLSWGAGAFFNPADPFAGSTDMLTGGLGTAPGLSGIAVNIPTGILSRLTAFRFLNSFSGIKYRTNMNGTDWVGALAISSDGGYEAMLQAQGDLVVGWFGQVKLTGLETADPAVQWAAGADYSWNGELILRGEVSNSGSAMSLPGLGAAGSTVGNPIAVGVSAQYIPDEFSAYVLTVMATPDNREYMVVPAYTSQLTDLLDLKIYGGLARAMGTNIGLAGAGLGYSF